MKDPARILGCRRGFWFLGSAWQQSEPSAMRIRGGSIADFRAVGTYQEASSPTKDGH